MRRNAVQTLLSSGRFAVIKGNEGEMQTVLSSGSASASASATQPQQRGVDSSATLSLAQKAVLARGIARRHRGCVAVVTGAADVLSDGRRVLRVDNGHAWLGGITGAGCTLGTTLSAVLAAWPGDPLLAAAAGVVMFGVAAEMAAGRAEVRGPGTFVPAFIDELYAIRVATAGGDLRWLTMAKVAVVEVEDTS